MRRAAWIAVWIACTISAPARAQDSGGAVDTRESTEKQIRQLEFLVHGDTPPEKQMVYYRWLADLYVGVGRLDDAQHAYEHILIFDPYDVGAVNTLAAFLLDRRHDAAGAEKILTATIGWAGSAGDPPPYLAQTYALQARALHELGRDDDALAASDHALARLDAEAAEDALRTQARCYESMGRRDDAEAAFTRLVGMTGGSNPDDVNALIAITSAGARPVDRDDINALVKRAIDTTRRERAETLQHEGAEMVVLAGADHVRLEGTLRRGKETAAIVFVPDLGGRRSSFTPYAQMFALDGVTTFTIDPRGHGDSRCDSLPSFAGMSAYNREQLPADIAAAVRYLHDTLRVPDDRIAVVAEGAACATLESAIHDQRIAPVVVHLSPVFDALDRDLTAAFSFRPKRPTLLVASDEDVFAVRSVNFMLAALPDAGIETATYHASGHGVAVLHDPANFAGVSAWTRTALGLPE